jgi:hypothetical protein
MHIEDPPRRGGLFEESMAGCNVPMVVQPVANSQSAIRTAVSAGDVLAGRGDLAGACDQYELAIGLAPGNANFHFRLGTLQWRRGRVEAGACIARAVSLRPDFAMGFAALSAWSLEHGLIEAADESSRIAMSLAPDDNGVQQARAGVLEAMGDLDAAWELTARLVGRGHAPMPVVRLYGRMARYHDQHVAALALVNQQLATGNHSPADQSRLHFTAAELLDSVGRYDEAFDHARVGNELARPPYDPAAHERTFDSLIDYFTRDRMARLARSEDRNETPVFIVGMPRSGTTLVEQILASHSAVHGAGELDFMQQVWAGTVGMISSDGAGVGGGRSGSSEYLRDRRLGPSDKYPACLDRLTMDQVTGISQVYLQPLIAMNPAAKRITDKLPLNFLHLGLISLLLPGARIIDCVRDPRDTCLSCYFATFNAGNDFKHDLNHAAHFYLQSRRLMKHWREVLDLPMLEVSYEQLVMEPESQARRMLEFLGLPWEAQCLDFHHSRRAVTTSSMQQVRRPMYQSSIGRWRHYTHHLKVLDKWFGPI